MGNVWDRFLTEQDAEHVRRQVRTPTGLGGRVAVVLIDLYKKVFGDRREPLLEAIERWPNSCGPAAWDALPHVVSLLETARATDIPVVHITGSADIPAWREVRGGGGPPNREELERGFRIMPDVAPQPGEPVIRKAAPSAFFGTPLEAYLRQLGVDGLIIAGESTSGCVRASVVDGRSHRFKVTVVEQCVFDRSQAAHAINLFDMAQKYADVRDVDDVVGELRLRTGAREGVLDAR